MTGAGMTDEASNWYIAVVNPNCHARAAGELASLGYSAFWPRLRRWVSHARTKIAKYYPVLGRYIFVEIPDRNFWTVRAVNGIELLLTDEAGSPARIPAAVVYSFRERFMAGEWDYVSQDGRPVFNEAGELETYVINDPLPIGGRIRIMEGEFENLLTVIRGYQNGKLKFLPPGKSKFHFTAVENARAA